jgi:cytochrome c peroxidase
VWDLIAKRLQAIPEYVGLFSAAYPHIKTASDITYVDAANAIGAFEAHMGRADNSPFDRYLAGDRNALNAEAFAGMWLFYGEARCAACHSGKFQTDQEFHSIAFPQIGGGKGDEADRHGDFGREQVTKNASDRFKFRTPNLRNVTLSAPYGHSGAFSELRDMVEHYIDPISSLGAYSIDKATLPSRADLDAIDVKVMSDPSRVAAIAATNRAPELSISRREVDQIMAFLGALEDPRSRNLNRFIPTSVPSGLPVPD